MIHWFTSRQTRYVLVAVGVLAAAVLIWRSAQPVIIHGLFNEELNDNPRKICAVWPPCKLAKVTAEYDVKRRTWAPVLDLHIAGQQVKMADAQQFAHNVIKNVTSKAWIMQFYADEFLVRVNGVFIPRAR